MATLEELEAKLAEIQAIAEQAREIASRHGPEHGDEGRDPYRQEGAKGHTHRTWAFFMASGGR